jgi:hypothetical protein
MNKTGSISKEKYIEYIWCIFFYFASHVFQTTSGACPIPMIYLLSALNRINLLCKTLTFAGENP